MASGGGLAIDGHGETNFKAELPGTALPYGNSRLWIQLGERNFYFKLRKRKT
jgi:hypothetical protein